VQATAQLEAVRLFRIANLDRAHDVTVLLAKQSHGAALYRFFLRHESDAHWPVVPNDLVDICLDSSQHLLVHRLAVAEIKTQPIWRHQRTRLRHVIAQMVA
jgi:hypothetical protein